MVANVRALRNWTAGIVGRIGRAMGAVRTAARASERATTDMLDRVGLEVVRSSWRQGSLLCNVSVFLFSGLVIDDRDDEQFFAEAGAKGRRQRRRDDRP
jgi:hypothetical protein